VSNPLFLTDSSGDRPEVTYRDADGASTARVGTSSSTTLLWSSADCLAHLFVDDAVEYLHLIADDFGVHSACLARVIVEGAERRAATRAGTTARALL